MTETEKAYIAGIIDGEGSVMLQSFHKNEFPSPCVSMASTTLELLNYLKETVGGGVIKHIYLSFTVYIFQIQSHYSFKNKCLEKIIYQ